MIAYLLEFEIPVVFNGVVVIGCVRAFLHSSENNMCIDLYLKWIEQNFM